MRHRTRLENVDQYLAGRSTYSIYALESHLEKKRTLLIIIFEHLYYVYHGHYLDFPS